MASQTPIISQPPIRDAAADPPGWKSWFTQVYNVVFSQQQSGTTANRPTKNLWIGRRYFDTTLGQAYYISAVSAAGVATWVSWGAGGAGGITHAFYAYNVTTSIFVANAATVKIDFSSVLYNQSGDYDGGTNTYTVPLTGIYYFAVWESAARVTLANAGTCRIDLFVNGSLNTTLAAVQYVAGPTNNQEEVMTGFAIASLTAADTVTIQVTAAIVNGVRVNDGGLGGIPPYWMGYKLL